MMTPQRRNELKVLLWPYLYSTQPIPEYLKPLYEELTGIKLERANDGTSN